MNVQCNWCFMAIRFLLTLLLIASPAFGWVVEWEQSTAAPETGVLLVGDNTEYTDTAQWLNGDTVYCLGGADGTAAVATGTAATGHLYINGTCAAGRNVKMLLYNQSTDALIEESTSVDCGDYTLPGEIDGFAFTTASITSGTDYRVCVVGDGSFQLYNDGTSTWVRADSSGTYASPPDPLPESNGAVGVFGGIWIEN